AVDSWQLPAANGQLPTANGQLPVGAPASRAADRNLAAVGSAARGAHKSPLVTISTPRRLWRKFQQVAALPEISAPSFASSTRSPERASSQADVPRLPTYGKLSEPFVHSCRVISALSPTAPPLLASLRKTRSPRSGAKSSAWAAAQPLT